jgi:flagellar basal-body rod protein FlgC
MDSASAIALSGMTAASTRLQVSASNVANADDAAPLPGSGVAGPAPFVPTRVSTVSLGANGVQAQLSAAQPGSTPSYAPSSPYADAKGRVATPNVDPVNEMVGQIQALQQFRASVAVFEADDKMKQSALDIFR